MKQLFIITIALLTFTAGKAQTLEEAKHQLYYERYETAKSILWNIIADDKASPDAWYLLGEIYLEQNKIDSAKNLLSGVPAHYLELNFTKKDNPLLFIGWAHVLLATGQKELALQQMDEILKASKYKNPGALLAVAKANMNSQNGDINWAIELLKKAVKRDKSNPEIYSALGDAYKKIVDGSNAIINYDKALEVNPAFAEAMYKKGRIYKSQNNPEIYMERFNKAYSMDNSYTPVLYELYYYYFFRDVVKADRYLKAYISQSDPSPAHLYMQTDLYYVSKKFDEAITEANKIISTEQTATEPRIYKLLAYSYAALGDSTTALNEIDKYFEKQKSSEYVSKDFELKAKLLEKINPDKSVAIEWYKKALASETDKKEKLSYMMNLADLQQELGNREREAVWREKVYQTKDKPTNLDIYKWGMALYSDKNYQMADSVFTIYEDKYPEQIHGYLWRARCNALIDTTMEKGLAVPHYAKLIEVASKDSLKNKNLLLRAYEYLGAYNANITKDYSASLQYFDKIIQIDPNNSDANKNVEVLSKWIENGKNNN